MAGAHHHPKKKHHKKQEDRKTLWADVGLAEPVQVLLDQSVTLPDWTRVTVQMPTGEGKLGECTSQYASLALTIGVHLHFLFIYLLFAFSATHLASSANSDYRNLLGLFHQAC